MKPAYSEYGSVGETEGQPSTVTAQAALTATGDQDGDDETVDSDD